MNLCANCGAVALYEYSVADSLSIKYCQRHLPKFALGSANLSVIPEEVAVVSSKNLPIKKAPKKAVAAPVVEEPEVVEPVVEETVVEEAVAEEASSAE